MLPKDYNFEVHKELVSVQLGDVPVTYANTTDLERDFGFKLSTSLRESLRKFAEWYKFLYINISRLQSGVNTHRVGNGENYYEKL